MRGTWNTPPPVYTPLSFGLSLPVYSAELCLSPNPITPIAPIFHPCSPPHRRRLHPRALLPITILALIWLLLGLCCLAVAVSLIHVRVSGCAMLWQGVVGAVGGIGVVMGVTVLARVAWLLRGVRVEDDEDDEGTDEGGFWGWVDGLIDGDDGLDEERGVVLSGDEEERLLLGRR